MKHPFAPVAVIVAALLIGCIDEAADNAAESQVVPVQKAAQQPKAEQRDTASAVTEPPCKSARLLKVRTVEMAEVRLGGPVPPTNEGEPRPVSSASSTMYYLSLDCGGKIYVARVPGGTPGFQPEELEAAGTLRLRVEGGRILLKSEAGIEFEANLIAAPTSESPPP